MSDEAGTLTRVQDIPSQALAEVLSRFGVHVAVLFGSAAKDRMRPDSDVDIAVLPSPDRSLSLDDELGLGVELDRLFQARDRSNRGISRSSTRRIIE